MPAIPSVIFVPYPSPGAIIAAGVVLPILGIITVVLRFYVRSSCNNVLSIDDWLVVPALFFVIGMGACLIAGVKDHGFEYPTPPPTGTTMEDFLTQTNPEIVKANQIQFSMILLMILAYSFIKLSIIFFYKKLFVVEKQIFRFFHIITWTMFSIVVVWTITFLIIFIFGCGKHFDAFWGSRLDLITYCSHGLQYDEGLFVSEFILNLILLVMPIPLIWRLKMPWKRRLAVIGILLLAFMALVASLFRLVIVLEVVSQSYAAVFDEDETISTIYYWSMIEAGLALIACSLPSLKPLVTSAGVQTALDSFRGRTSIPKYNTGSSKQSTEVPTIGSRDSNLFRVETDYSFGELPLRGDRLAELKSHVTCSRSDKLPPEAGIRIQRDVSVERSKIQLADHHV